MLSLILGAAGLILCQLCSPVAWYVGQRELRAIRSGRSQDDPGLARVGMILGIVGTVLLVAGVAATFWIWYRWEWIMREFSRWMAAA